MISDYDKRQVILLKKQIDYILNGQMSLEEFISRVEALLNVMENIDDDWKESIYQNWMNLEIVFASNVNTGKPIDDIDKKTLNYSLNEIETLTNTFILDNKIELSDG